MKLVLATRNPHKLREIREIFALPGLEIVSALDFPDVPEVVEDGDTFQENAIKKAMVLAMATKHWALADDSGLEVDALGGEPGVRSARFAGEPVDYEANNRRLLELLKDESNRRARFRCVLALSSPGGRVQIVEGTCEGTITREARGSSGFGYDPLFVPDGYSRTFAEMDAAEKNKLSHRARALEKAREKWGGILGGEGQEWSSFRP
ncbi:MAG: XTP/dITP diphosphatase [Kiritimatiellae bacterium]|nr:XTP/dITP diphosphatase [Kiritimatiellia bacterium]